MIYLSVCPTIAFTRKVILGTTNGQLYETSIEEKDKKEKYVKLLFEITEAPEPFISVQVTTLNKVYSQFTAHTRQKIAQ